jgi:uncharacterized protein (TIGR02466 family)|tara:strand:+ start:65 stop:661 length:597 start_codon:yes stop_codon:yes gene_type:complete
VQIIPIFSKPIYINKINIETKKIFNILNNFHLSKSRDDSKSSDIAINYNVLNMAELNELKEKIVISYEDFLNNNLHYKNKFKITTSWITRTLPGQKSHAHNHLNSMFSGVFYVQTKKNCGKIQFQNLFNKTFHLNIKSYNIYNSDFWDIEPSDGLILIFPSEIYHQVLENFSDLERVSIAFNLLPIGKIGEHDSQLKL